MRMRILNPDSTRHRNNLARQESDAHPQGPLRVKEKVRAMRQAHPGINPATVALVLGLDAEEIGRCWQQLYENA